MSLEQRRTKLVLSVIESLVEDGITEFQPGHIATRLREWNQPLGAWQVRGDLSTLEADGVIENDAETGYWRLAAERARKAG
ncbi:MAG: hypothetical protein ACOC9Q_00050 [bacterium]